MTQSADEIREAAKAAEREGRPADALAIVDGGIVANPNRADLHALRARLLLVEGSDLGAAARHATRAAQLEPGNSNYREMAKDYCKRAGIAEPDLTTGALPAVAAEPVAAKPAPKRASGGGGIALPSSGKEWAIALLAIAAVVVLGGWNVWYWVLRPAAGRPSALDVSRAAQIVPVTSLQRLGTTAYGTVTPAWTALADREKKVSSLAESLAAQGILEIVLTDEQNHLVARGTKDAATVFSVATKTAPPAAAASPH